ncbi:MAG: TlpA family protein disulfide reductase, partial [Muribaculaceae bacterium]|nr:TlpA family protein disulfide reductase [Muribaculaceae bacterium]
YADLGFYDKEGMTHIRGRITDYSPKYGVSTYSIRTKDDFTNVEKVNVGDINPDGTFGIDIPLAYPQSDYFQLGDINRNLFLIPGDTLSIVTCMAQTIDPKDGYVPEYWGFEGSPSDGAVINMLVDSLYNRYDLNSMYKRYRVENPDSMTPETYRQNERLAALLDSVLVDIQGFVGNLPVSEFAKDVLTILAIGQIYGQTEENQLTFRMTKGASYTRDADGNLVAKEPELLDDKTILNPWMRHRDLIYNNPLLLSHGWVLPNRWSFNSQFQPSKVAAEGVEEVPGSSGYQVYQESENLSKTYSRVIDCLDSIGLGNCFVAQFVRTSTLIDNLNKDTDPSSEKLKDYNRLASQVIRHNDYDRLNEILMAELNDYVGKVMIAENRLTGPEDNGMAIPDTPEGKVLSRIIEPYKGNVLYLDFWGIGCGPCRAGMMNQKPLLEKLADRPFRALYIAEADQMEACNEWLEKEGIKGEHLFISQDDWKRLTGLFNFSAIPFGVLIGRDGKILKTHYNLYEEDPLLKKALEE